MTPDDIKERLSDQTAASVSEEAFDLLLQVVTEIVADEGGSVPRALLNLSLNDTNVTVANYSHIECEGGEGEGDYAHGIFQLNDTIYMFGYGYASYDGFQPEYGTVTVVKPVQKQVTVYEAV